MADLELVKCFRFVMNALKAKEFYRRDVQYIVRNGKALIINEVLLQFRV
jgi:preprotein translocase subunit SecA